jgi:hypothetical protein
MHRLPSLPLVLLAVCLVAGTAGATTIDTPVLVNAADDNDGPLTLETEYRTVDVNEPFSLAGTITLVSTGLPYQGLLNLQEQAPGGAYRTIDSTTTASDGSYSFTVTRAVPGLYRYRVELPGYSMSGDDWAVTVRGTLPTTAVTTTVPITMPTVQGGATYAQARDYYIQATGAWSQAWGASDFVLIRQYLNQAKTLYTNSLNTANAVNDPANAANLALVKSVSTAYISLADAALAMYDAADAYGTGQAQVGAGSYAAAATSFQTAAEKDERSKTLFNEATTTLQSVSYAGTEYGDGTAYTAAIVPILNGKAAYVGDYATYARAWQHTALALQARAAGNDATFRSEATQAMTLFGSLRASQSFGTDATTNYDILVGMLGSTTPEPVTTTPTPTTVTTTQTPAPSTRLATGTWIFRGSLSGSRYLSVENQNAYDAVITLRKLASPPESGEKIFSFYLRANDQHRVTGIPIGSYTLWYKLGESWDQGTSSFIVNHVAKRFEDPFDYDAVTAGWNAKILPVADGNAPTEPVSPDLV